jgi:hypothetical protein
MSTEDSLNNRFWIVCELSGDTKTVPGRGYVIKEDDYKVAWVILVRVDFQIFVNVHVYIISKEYSYCRLS